MFRPPDHFCVVGSGPTVTGATERNGRASAKYTNEPVSLMELRVTKCLKYHRLEQEGPVCKDGRFGGVSQDISETAVAQGNENQECTGSGRLAPGPWPLTELTDCPCSCQTTEKKVERPGLSSGSVFSSIGQIRLSRRNSSQLEPDQTVTARWRYGIRTNKDTASTHPSPALQV